MKDMTITYEVGNALYVNMTNRCSNRCDFCIRNNGEGAYGSDPLWLLREPTREEVIADIRARDLSAYTELVFCGYGEPTERLEALIYIAKNIKSNFSIPIRVNTNGHSSMIFGKDTAPMYADAVDTVSISLNAQDAQAYDRICHSVFGLTAYDGMLDFAKRVQNYVPHVVFTVVDTFLTDAEISACKKVAETVGIPLRVRRYIGKSE